MAGTVATLQKCRNCGGKFQPSSKGFICPPCQTTPTRFYVDVYVPGKLLGEPRGKRIRLYSEPDGVPLDSYIRADRLLNIIRAELEKGNFDHRSYVSQELKPLKFHNYYQAWLERLQHDVERRYISRAYFKEIKGYGHRYFLPFFGSLDIRNINKTRIRDFFRQLPAHLSKKTIRNIRGVLHKLFVEALEREDILTIPQFPKIAKEEAVTRALRQEEQAKILSHIRMPVYRAFPVFCMCTGVRTGEARALTWENVNLRDNVVTIRASFDLGHFKPYTKEGDVRYLSLLPLAREALLSLPRPLRGGFVFTNSRGRPLSQRRINTVWQQAAKEADIEITCYEATRHSFASQLIEQGVPERAVGDLLGHKTSSSTRRYAKMRAEQLRAILETCPQQIGPQYDCKEKIEIVTNGNH